jgi:hypothetical protein
LKWRHEAKPLTLFHVSALLLIEDGGNRNAVLKQCLAESWSVRKVRIEVQNLIGCKRSWGGRTPKPKKIPTPAIALHDIQLNAKQWMGNHAVWFAGKKGEDGEIKEEAALSKVQKKYLTGELLADLEKAEEGLVKVNAAMMKGLKTLRELKKMTKQAVGKGG